MNIKVGSGGTHPSLTLWQIKSRFNKTTRVNYSYKLRTHKEKIKV